jgi:hypothetical protein
MAGRGRPKKKELVIPEVITSLKPKKIIKGQEIWSDNPFITSGAFVVPTRDKSTIIADGLTIMDQSQVHVDTGIIGRVKTIDTEQFVKLYAAGVSEMFEISRTAQRVLQVLIMAIQHNPPDQAHVFLTYDPVAVQFYQMLDISHDKIPIERSFLYGIKELIKAKFIARHHYGTGWYWTNPKLLFNGDRVTFVTQYRKKRKDEQQYLEKHQYKLPI